MTINQSFQNWTIITDEPGEELVFEHEDPDTGQKDRFVLTEEAGLGSDLNPFEGVASSLAIKGQPVHDIRAYGAEVDGVTDDLSAVNSAISAAAQDNGVVFFPKGTTLVDGEVTLTSAENGITIAGLGYASELKMAGSQGSTTTTIQLDDNTTALQNITISNLRINGNRANQTENVFGLQTVDNSNQDENLNFRRIWSHDCSGSGISMNTPAQLTGVVSWNNGLHGVGLNNTAERKIKATNLTCFDNDSYGVDASSGRLAVNWFECYNNSSGGAKTSTTASSVSLSNGFLYSNSLGFTMSGTADKLVLKNIHAFKNDGRGFRIGNGSAVYGSIYAEDNNDGGSAPEQVFITGSGTRFIRSIEAKDSDARGITTSGSVEIYGGPLVVENNTIGILMTDGTADVDYFIADGNSTQDANIDAGAVLRCNTADYTGATSIDGTFEEIAAGSYTAA